MSRKKEKRTGGTGEINWKRIEELLNQKWKNGNTYFYKRETCEQKWMQHSGLGWSGGDETYC